MDIDLQNQATIIGDDFEVTLNREYSEYIINESMNTLTIEGVHIDNKSWGNYVEL